MDSSQRSGLSILSPDLIDEISTYLTEDENESACIALDPFFRCTNSVVYHVNAINKPRKRKRSLVADSFDTHRQRVWQLLQDPDGAARLRRLTLLQPFDYGAISESLPMSQFCDIRKHRNTVLVEKDSHVDHVLEVVRQNARELRFFETTLLRPLKPLLHALINLAELKIPSTTSLEDINLPSLRRLTIVHTSVNNRPADLPSIPSLERLDVELRWLIMPCLLPEFVDLDGFPNLRVLCLTATGQARTLGLGSYPDANIFQGYSSSLRSVSVQGPFLFKDFASLKHWLTRLSAKTLCSLTLRAIEFGYNLDDVPWSLDPEAWPEMRQLHSLELGELELTYFQALPCHNLRKLFVLSTYGPLEDDVPLTHLLKTAALNLEAISIIEQKYPRLWNYNQYLVFSDDFVNTLARCLKLRHFESVGCHYFDLDNWQFLCTRVFLSFDQVHVEAQHPKQYNRPDKLDLLCLESTAEVSPAHLLDLYDGRMYVSPRLSPQWLHNEDERSTAMVKNIEYDRSQSITRFLCQQFRRQADVEGDLQTAEGLIPSPRLLESVWFNYPADVCKRLRCLPVEWSPVYELL